MSQKKNHSLDMTQGNPYRLLFKFAIPLLLGNMFQQLYNTVDSMVVGNMVGTKALASVGTGFPFLMALVSFFIGISIAATVMISQAFGAKNFDRVNTIVNTIYRIARAIIIPLTLLGVLGARTFLVLMNVPDDGTLQYAVEYLQILFLGMFATMGYNLNAGFLQGLGDSVTSLKLLILSTFINIGLDLLFVGPFHMGVGGAALATLIAQAISWILGLLYINKHYHYLHINLFKLKFDRDIFKTSLRMGLPSALQNMLFSVGSMAMGALVNSCGSTFIAGFNGANKIDTFIFFPIQSFANATTTFTGQNVGARNLDRVRMGLKSGLVVSVGASLLTAVILYPISPYAMQLFGTDPGMIEAGMVYLHTVVPFYFLLAILFTVNSVIRGVGRMTVPLFATLCALLLGRVPMAYFLHHHFGQNYMFYSYAFGWTVGCCISVGYYIFGKWRAPLEAELQKGTTGEEELEAAVVEATAEQAQNKVNE